MRFGLVMQSPNCALISNREPRMLSARSCAITASNVRGENRSKDALTRLTCAALASLKNVCHFDLARTTLTYSNARSIQEIAFLCFSLRTLARRAEGD